MNMNKEQIKFIFLEYLKSQNARFFKPTRPHINSYYLWLDDVMLAHNLVSIPERIFLLELVDELISKRMIKQITATEATKILLQIDKNTPINFENNTTCILESTIDRTLQV